MEIKDKKDYVFQIDSEIVNDIYNTRNNYLISYNEDCLDKNTCAIYFSSNDIYFPNSEEVFNKKIVEKDFFEWYGTRVKNVYKHILLRDVHKQWYLTGINEKINSPENLLEFLIQQTEGCSVTTLGSSAGGYAAVLYGSLLNAKKAIVFNAQFEIQTLLDSSSKDTDPLIFRFQNLPVSKYYDIKPFISKELEVYYFMSLGSEWDFEQYTHIKDVDSINVLKFKTKHHGIPFLKSALDKVVNLEGEKLKKYTRLNNYPILFTIRMVGLLKTFNGAKKQLLAKYKKK